MTQSIALMYFTTKQTFHIFYFLICKTPHNIYIYRFSLFFHLFFRRYDDIICIYRLRFYTVSEKAQWTLDIKPLTIYVWFGSVWYGWVYLCMYVCLYVCARTTLLIMCMYMLVSIYVYAVHQIYIRFWIHSPVDCQIFYLKPSEIFKSIQSIWVDCQELKQQ